MQLRPSTSARPEFVVDQATRIIAEPPLPSTSQVGQDGPLGRSRVIATLPMAPVWLERHKVLHDQDGFYVADPQGNLIGMEGVVVSRMVSARWVEDTRGLGG